MKASIALKLGRISNLPTVWTNVLVGAALSGAVLRTDALAALIVSLSLFYVGGMFLNDAFDREFDRRHRPERPIPSGAVTATEVFASGFAMLVLGLAGVVAAGWMAASAGGAQSAALAGAGLGGAIVLYDAWHKGNPLSPLVMGACRVLVYVCACVALAGTVPVDLGIAAAGLLCHLIGVTYLAKQEHLDRVGNLWPLGFLIAAPAYGATFIAEAPAVIPSLILLVALNGFALARFRRRGPGDVPKAVITLLAAISVYDAMILAGHGHAALSACALAGFALMLFLQRWVKGT